MINITKFLYIPLILYFFPAFVFFIGEKSYFPFLIIIVPIAMVLLSLHNKQNLFKEFCFLYKNTQMKYFVYLYCWLLLSSFISFLCGYYSFYRFLLYVIIGFTFRGVLLYLFPQFVIPKFVSLKNIIKLFVIAYLFIFLWGIFEFIGAYFQIDIINSCISFLSNIREEEKSLILESLSGLPRIRSVSMEPGTFGLFIAVNLPIIYSLCLSKYKVLNNTIMNFVTKKSLIILAWICLIMTQSPIYLIICSLLTIVIFFKRMLCFLKKHYKSFLLLFVILTCVIFLVVNTVDLSKSYISRILNFVSELSTFDIERIIFADPSMGTRIVNNINQICLFLKHPVWGIGFGNNGPMLISQLAHSPIPLTSEMQKALNSADNSIAITSNAMYYLLFQTGLIGFALYCLFMTKCIKYLNKVKKYFYGIEFLFVDGLRKSLMCMFLISILYNQNFVDQYVFFLTSISCAIVVIAKLRIKKLNESERQLVDEKSQ